MKDILIVFFIGYAIGNIQTSYILGKLLYHVDIRTLGHGNAGASNAFVSFGVKFGLMVAFVDIIKGFVSILIVRSLYHVGFTPDEALLLYVNGYGAILGHIYPFFMHFKGGKGTATLLGVLLGFDWMLGLAAIVFIVVLTFITDYVAISTAALVVAVIGLTIYKQMGIIPIALTIFGALLSLYKHRKNYGRIPKNEEGRLSESLAKLRKNNQK